MQVRRLLEIILLLLHGRCGTLRELSEHCSVSVDAIKNDIGILKNSGIPIRCCSASGTVSLPEGFTLETMFKPRRERSAEMSYAPPLPDGGGYPGFTYPPQHRHMAPERKRNELVPGVYAFVGYSSSNFGVIASEHGYILIDAGDDLNGAAEALREIKNLIPGGVQAVILTHSHPDHRGGAEIFLEGRRDVPVWGHADFGAEQRAGRGLERVSAERAARQFGAGIPDADYPVNFMLPRFAGGKSGPLLSPNIFVTEDRMPVRIDGVNLELHRIPGESTDHLVVWLPERQVLFSGDHVYRSFPNIYPVRGGVYRDVEQWAKAVRRLMDFRPKAMMFGHNAVPAPDEILPMLSGYAEAIEYVYAETLKGMNQGKTPDELAASLRLPGHLRDQAYLGEFYGAVPWAVRSIYAHKLGWFDGNPTTLVPLTPLEEAERMAALAGGSGQLLRAAQNALAGRDYRWAAKLADYLLQLGETENGKAVKAAALEGLSRDILPVAGKNYLLRSVLDLRK